MSEERRNIFRAMDMVDELAIMRNVDCNKGRFAAFTIEERIGGGAEAEVFRAHDEATGRQ